MSTFHAINRITGDNVAVSADYFTDGFANDRIRDICVSTESDGTVVFVADSNQTSYQAVLDTTEDRADYGLWLSICALARLFAPARAQRTKKEDASLTDSDIEVLISAVSLSWTEGQILHEDAVRLTSKLKAMLPEGYETGKTDRLIYV